MCTLSAKIDTITSRLDRLEGLITSQKMSISSVKFVKVSSVDDYLLFKEKIELDENFKTSVVRYIILYESMYCD